MFTIQRWRQGVIIMLTPFFIFLFCGLAWAYTVVSGGTIASTSWGPGAVYVTGSVTVESGATLTIQSGTVVKANPGVRVWVSGTLDAVGTVAEPIVFTSRDDDGYGETIPGSDGSPAPGDWQGIYLCGSGSSYEGIGNFDHCRIRCGGNNGNATFY